MWPTSSWRQCALLFQSRHRPSWVQRTPLSIQSSFSTSPSSNPSNSTWERSAKLVKNTDCTNPYLDKIRAETVDTSLQLKTIEDELCGAIGKALGRQGEKVLFAIRDMEKERGKYQDCLRIREFHAALEYADRYNEARKRALKARWELLVHRQAVGFTTENHNVVHSTFPISDALPSTLAGLEESLVMQSSSNTNNMYPRTEANDAQQRQKFGDQLSWWQRVGRWK
ncbi:hypothetical protein HJC23_003533 [Cyclotella cryptica]|uniref:Uncharacterized protein n=1 Tax=Cyclotella cryptica TaxID=29204 RepID=A0ABD3P148_9STRA|eukprot:CCRYP_018590-RA/>CCRYP_018590-RA protein AED:0.00 eAED:0.00 QI:119/-1/1/1/-1/1/1/128/225